MALETGTYISDLVATNPTSGDNQSQGDDHLRLIKAALLATFPALTGAVTASHSEINAVADGAISGGTVTQLTNKGTGVTLNTRTGQITMAAGNILAEGRAIFTLTNSTIGAADFVAVQRKSGGTESSYRVWCDSSAAGSAEIIVENRTASTVNDQVVLQFVVIKGATS